MIQHKPIRKPSTHGSYLPKGLTKSLLLRVDVYSAPKNYFLARRDRPEGSVKGYRSAKVEWALPTLRDRKIEARTKNLRIGSNATQN
ncbi:hypothetical protein HC931_09470 [Candidatus Gracilibacteria bacterium]|jgi:hypothetical protein|nr:hypothetical protein [Candidatus Gracilibacteria bacterium]NJM87004.1 hypothetical protein [Hydrococcus sp. RU_2_2]NJP18829.1 hypothetical protein [Hydrococcus sp. CRU_1_1]